MVTGILGGVHNPNCIYVVFFQDFLFKGQLGVPLTMYPWYLLDSLGILGDEKTHKYPRAIGLIFGDFPFSGVHPTIP